MFERNIRQELSNTAVAFLHAIQLVARVGELADVETRDAL
jgi:hypothetical protein